LNRRIGRLRHEGGDLLAIAGERNLLAGLERL
jgi:hypothetical protein